MHATQFVRRGLVAFAAAATLTFGLTGVASAQLPGAFPGNSPGAVVDGDDAIVWVPLPGYVYDIVHTDGERTAVLAVGLLDSTHPVVVEFVADFDGAAIITPGAIEDVVAERIAE